MHMATPTEVDRSAPVLVHHETDIQAPLGVVWELHSGVDAWPSWHSQISDARIDGAFAPGSSFTWTSYGFTVTSTIYAVRDQSGVLWGGTGDGTTGIHEWIFDETPSGVHVTTNESLAGQPVEVDVAGMRTMLDASLVAWLAELKAAAEAKS
jgi:hypothetical protein